MVGQLPSFVIGRMKKNSVQAAKTELGVFFLFLCWIVAFLHVLWISQHVFWYIIMTLWVQCSLWYVLFYSILEDRVEKKVQCTNSCHQDNFHFVWKIKVFLKNNHSWFPAIISQHGSLVNCFHVYIYCYRSCCDGNNQINNVTFNMWRKLVIFSIYY